MSSTSCCAVKKFVMLHWSVAGKLAEGVPHSEMSMEDVDVAPVIDGGTLDRCVNPRA